MRANRLLLIALLAALVVSPTAGAQDTDDRDITVLSTDEAITATELSVRMSEQVDFTEPPGLVALASSESFADALASGALQSTGPLLLLPPELPVPPRLQAELHRLQPERLVLLGGTAVIPQEVEDELNRLGWVTERRSGPSRIETAIDVAATDAPASEFAILVRAFEGTGDPTQAWADSVTAGAMAAQFGWPVLLTHSSELTGATYEYLVASQVTTVVIVGGRAAVGDGVRRTLAGEGMQVLRVDGPNRFQTAMATSSFRGVGTERRTVLFDGTSADGWQAGFVAARHAALTGASMIPVSGDQVPPEVAEYLAAARPSSVTCILPRSLCDTVLALAQRPARPYITFNPPSGSAISPANGVTLQVDDPDRLLAGEVSVTSNCGTTNVEYLPEGRAVFGFTLTPEEPGGDQSEQPAAEPSESAPPGGGEPDPETPGDVATEDPFEDNEPAPSEPAPATCIVVASAPRTDGGELVELASFHVVDLRPRIRVATFPQVEDRPLSFLDRSDGVIDQWAWDFADGGTSTESDPTHTFARSGCYDVSLTVSSPLVNAYTGTRFSETEIRTVAVDDSDPDESTFGVKVVRDIDGVPVRGIEVALYDRSDGTPDLVGTARSDSAGRVTFRGLDAGSYRALYTADPDIEAHEPYDVVTSPIRIDRDVIGGATVCTTLRMLLPGHALIELLDNDTQTPISGTVSIRDADGTLIERGSTTGSGLYLTGPLSSVLTYTATATASGHEPQEATFVVPQADTVDVPILLQRTPPP